MPSIVPTRPFAEPPFNCIRLGMTVLLRDRDRTVPRDAGKGESIASALCQHRQSGATQAAWLETFLGRLHIYTISRDPAVAVLGTILPPRIWQHGLRAPLCFLLIGLYGTGGAGMPAANQG